MKHRRSLLATLALLFSAFAPAAVADRVITVDGRVIHPKKARQEGAGYRLFFEHGEILVKDRSLIRSIEIEGDMSDYVPQNEDERQKLEQGFVRFEGRWYSKAAYELELKKRYEAARTRAEMLTAHSSWPSAWVQETRHFVIKTNTSPELLTYYGNLLEAYYKLMDDRIGIDPTPSMRRTKMSVNVYKSHAEFLELSGASSPSVLGFFSPTENTLNFYHDYAEPARSDWVALHECTHLLTYLVDQQFRPQIWINEAVADYFGSADIEVDARGKVTIKPGKLQTDRVLTVQQALKEGNYTTLEKLFRLEQPAFDGFQYAHAWSFVYFLNNYAGGKYTKGFDKFFKDLYTTAKGVPYQSIPSWGSTGTGKRVTAEDIQALLLDRIKVKDLAELERQWKEFIAAVPIESVEARLKRGMRVVQSFDLEKLDEALADLDAAIAGGTKDPRAYAARARARALKSGPQSALEDIRMAIELDPLDAGFRYQLSTLLARRAGPAPQAGPGRTAASSAEGQLAPDPDAKNAAGLAMELDPDNDRFKEWYQLFP